MKNVKVSFNSPVILGFTLACFAVMLLSIVTGGASNRALFSVYASPLSDPLTYLRLFGHVLGHGGWDHFMGNIMLILIVGPLLEEKYGSRNILTVIAVTALVTGIINVIIFPHSQLLGASGVVFAFILLSSLTCIKDGQIPLTFILVAVLYIGQQIFDGIFVSDNVSNLTHIVGGIVGTILGYSMNKGGVKKA
ncbi:MAG: rhomboid family intramembrane serine protease [bacterium]|nr:rhomboid family intramembrane serine protease [bacterium]